MTWRQGRPPRLRARSAPSGWDRRRRQGLPRARPDHARTRRARRGHRVGVVEVLARPALLPARDGAPDGLLVEARRARKQRELRRGLEPPGRASAGRSRWRPPPSGRPSRRPKPLVVEADAPAVDAEVAHRGAHLLAAVEPVGGTRLLHPVDPGRRARDGARRRPPAGAGGPSATSPTGRGGRPSPKSAGEGEWSGSSRPAPGWGARARAGPGSAYRAAARRPCGRYR